MDGASLCIYTVSSINNPRCAWHGGVPESPFVIMDGWRLHKLLSPAESALCQAPHASRGLQHSRRDTRRVAPRLGSLPPSHGHQHPGGSPAAGRVLLPAEPVPAQRSGNSWEAFYWLWLGKFGFL